VRFLFFLLILFGCQTKHNLKPSDTKLKESERNWEALYARELSNALTHEDVAAFHFFGHFICKKDRVISVKNTTHNII